MANDGPDLTYRARLTRLFDYYVDLARIGDLFKSGHRYSYKEIATRAMIWGSGFAGAYLGYQYGGWGYGALGFTGGFLASHSYVIAPLVLKRYRASQACDEKINQIDLLLDGYKCTKKISQDKMKVIAEKAKGVALFIKSFGFTQDKAGDASKTWGTRKRLLTNLYNMLETDLSEISLAEQPSPVFARKMDEHWNIPPADLKAELEQPTSTANTKKRL